MTGDILFSEGLEIPQQSNLTILLLTEEIWMMSPYTVVLVVERSTSHLEYIVSDCDVWSLFMAYAIVNRSSSVVRSRRGGDKRE